MWRRCLVCSRRPFPRPSLPGPAPLEPAVLKSAPASARAPLAHAGGDPWLPQSYTAAVWAAWPDGVEWKQGVRFYNLAKLYQELTTSGGGSVKHNVPLDIHDHEDSELTMSGGMVGLRGWSSSKGLWLPPGKAIRVWKEDTEVRAFAPVPRWRWEFPVGTVAYDILHKPAGDIFAIRSQTKAEDGWETKVLYRDERHAPEGFHGVGKACVSCHSHAGEVVSVPGRIYMRVRWGDDNRFSWRPFDENANLDMRWPIEVVSGR